MTLASRKLVQRLGFRGQKRAGSWATLRSTRMRNRPCMGSTWVWEHRTVRLSDCWGWSLLHWARGSTGPSMRKFASATARPHQLMLKRAPNQVFERRSRGVAAISRIGRGAVGFVHAAFVALSCLVESLIECCFQLQASVLGGTLQL